MATHVSEHNCTAWIYELITGERYSTCPSKSAKMEQKLSPRVKEECLDKITEIEESDSVESEEAAKNEEVVENNDINSSGKLVSVFNVS